MTLKNRKYFSIHFISSIFAVSGIMKIHAALKNILAIFRFLKPAHRKSHSRKEMEAFKTTANIKRNNGFGLGPPM